jgi:hypothetical protein
MPSNVSNLAEMGAKDWASVVINDDCRVIEELETCSAQLEADFGVFSSVEGRRPAADGVDGISAGYEVIRGQIIALGDGGIGNEPVSKRATSEA